MPLHNKGGFIPVQSGIPTSSSASGIWSLPQQLQAIAAGNWPQLDPYYEYVSLLLTGDGTNGAQNNTFLDSSSNNFTITRNGNTTQGTFSPYGNLWSNYFDGTGDYLVSPTSSAWGFDTGDFTLECWVNLNSVTTISALASNYSGSSWSLQWRSDTAAWTFNNASTTLISYTNTPNIGVWNHIAVTRSGTSLRMFLNGTQVASVTNSTNMSSSLSQVYIGSLNAVTQYTNGYISNVRVVKGTAVYTANFTPSTTPLTAVSGTLILTCQSNRFIDNSSNNFAITANGNTSVQRFSPFNPTASYSASTIGGSGYFDGTGDYLTTPATSQFAPTGDFTIGAWVYPTSLATAKATVGNYTGNNATDWIIDINTDGTVRFYTNGASLRISSAAGAVKANQWNYLSMSRSGSTITGYVNGSSAGTYTQSGTFGSASKSIYIGSQAGTSELLIGYLSDIKLIDGSVVTTVPTITQTATTGTKLLLNFTNAGIPDAAMMNDLETVGNAQVSTSVKKYGTGSLAFDGFSAYLSVPYNVTNKLPTGDWTIEFWMYCGGAQANSTSPIYVQDNTGNYSGIVISANASREVSFSLSYTGATWNVLWNTIGTYTDNTWNHVAVVRSGSSVYGFFNGALTATTSGVPTSLYSTTDATILGKYNAWYFNGYIDDLRITKGYARYTANFTPPNAALPTF